MRAAVESAITVVLTFQSSSLLNTVGIGVTGTGLQRASANRA